MSQSAEVSRTKQMSLEQPFKLSETNTTVDELAACSIDVVVDMTLSRKPEIHYVL